tara:strand:+ start:1134 stop:2057 length:924 start_codon:yes stop_codon:yes gene_type:complete
MKGKVEPEKCRFCKAGSVSQSLRAKHVFGSNNKHQFFQCSKCELVYLYPIPSEEEEDKFYADEFEKFMERRSGGDMDWSGPEEHKKSNQENVERRLDFLQEYIKPGIEVLEFGCSSGFMMDKFRELKMKSYGIEPSGSFTSFLKENNHNVFNSLDELKKTHPSKKFDLITHFFVLEHVRDTQGFLNDQIELLKPEGVIIAEVPCVLDPLTSLYKIEAFEKFYWSIAHHYYFSPRSISNILENINCRFKIVPEQRYDLSNHLTWLEKGKPGGQKRFNDLFSNELLVKYKESLINAGFFDTFFLYIWKA